MRSVRPARYALRLAAAAAMVIATLQPAAAQEDVLTADRYVTPVQELADLALAPWWQNESMSNRSPDGRLFLRTIEDGLPSIATFAKRFYRLGGLQIDPAGKRNRRFTQRSNMGYELIDPVAGERIEVEIPRGARVSSPQWSPDGSRLAFLAHFPEESHIYVADTDDGDSRRVTRDPVLLTLNTSYEWTADGRYIITTIVPEDRREEPVEADIPGHPMVRLTEEGKNELRVYASLLESPYEQELLEYHVTSQLARIEVDRRRSEPIGEPGMIERFDTAPTGEHLRVTTMTKPFSYIVPVSRFGSVEEVWDIRGEVMTEIEEEELRTGVDDRRRDDPGARRNLMWRPDGKGLSYLQMEPRKEKEEAEEQEEEEEEEEEEERKDRVMLWTAPFDSTSVEVVYESETRIRSVAYRADAGMLFITEREGGEETLYAVSLDDPETRLTLYTYKTSDFYADPGSLMSKRGPMGGSVVRISSDGGSVYLSGTEYSEDPTETAPRPFIDRVEIASGETERVWQSSETMYERVIEVMDDDLARIIVSRESPLQVPDSWLIDLESGEETRLTENRNFAPQISSARRDRFKVRRADGFTFWTEVVFPPGYVGETELPAMFWFYPREYTSQKDYDEGQRRYNKNSFPRMSTRDLDYLITQGYLVVYPDCPIVGEGDMYNYKYVPDLRNSLAAVIAALDDKGWIDRDRLAIGGHSYGAFGTANAMIHTPFFKAGIAGDGNYNRLLTPMGFQRERRILWEGREVYLRMSPLLWANELNGALLMYHGMDDQNVGTAPFHAPKMFHALNGLGKTASLYMYPYEDHGPATEETVLDLWARWHGWLETHVKNWSLEEEMGEEKEK
ncbi:MAG: prolyl oligopeptidase family serine peptidase [bacterium]